MKRLMFTLFVLVTATGPQLFAQSSPQPCGGETPMNGGSCPTGWTNTNNPYANFSAQNLLDGNTSQSYYGYIPTLYGSYGSNEKLASGAAQTHYQEGVTLAGNIRPLCGDGTTNLNLQGSCQDNSGLPVIILLFIGFSNLDIEIGGGSSDIWPKDPNLLQGQPCATNCPNPDRAGDRPWNQPVMPDNDQENSLLRLAYPNAGTSNLASSVVLFNGALGNQLLAHWDPTSIGFYANNICTLIPGTVGLNPECNYGRVNGLLTANGYTANQVQAVFLKSADAFPAYCLNTSLGCATPSGKVSDLQQSEMYMGDILRFLKSGYQGYPIPYPNLQQVFVTSRTYGGYGVQATQPYGCLSPEPFAFEEGLAVQETVLAQINSNALTHAGNVDYPLSAPWFDWAPYLWAPGNTPRSDGLFWCGGQPGACSNSYDVRNGDPGDEMDYWGDYTHPSYRGLNKVANILFQWLTGTLGSSKQTFTSDWVTPWAITH